MKTSPIDAQFYNAGCILTGLMIIIFYAWLWDWYRVGAREGRRPIVEWFTVFASLVYAGPVAYNTRKLRV